MNKMTTTAKFGVGAAAAAALTFGAVGVVGAQDAQDPVTNDSDTTAVEQDSDRAERRAARQERRAEKRAAIAEILGLSEEELSEARESGQSLSEIAGDNIDELVTFFVDSVTERVDAAVENGRISEEEAAEKLEDIEERITTRIENADGEREGRRGFRGHRGERGQATETLDA